MKHLITRFASIISILFIFACFTKQNEFPELKGPYLGQIPPGMTPEIFAPGIVSTGAWEYGTAFSLDGREFYYAIAGAPYNVIAFMKEENDRWTRPERASFSGQYDEHDMNFSPDGKRLYYTSKRPLSGTGEPKDDNDIWAVTKTESGWSEPENLGSFINTGGSENYSTLTLDGTMYFHRYEKDGRTDSDIFVARLIDGRYEEPQRLGVEVNSDRDEWDPFVAPDGNYLIFSSIRRPDSYGPVDLYISFRKEDGSWTEAKNMGEGINSTGSENCASVTHDGKYFFFLSTRRTHKTYSENPMTLAEKFAILNRHGNGNGDIYWVDAEIIADLKPDHLK